jgi:hypothetical protein
MPGGFLSVELTPDGTGAAINVQIVRAVGTEIWQPNISVPRGRKLLLTARGGNGTAGNIGGNGLDGQPGEDGKDATELTEATVSSLV